LREHGAFDGTIYARESRADAIDLNCRDARFPGQFINALLQSISRYFQPNIVKVGWPGFDSRQDVQIPIDQYEAGARCAAINANN
jgi:hypothetical protein